MALTNDEICELLDDVKAYLNITWSITEQRERLLLIYIRNSISYLERAYGYALDFIERPEEPQNPEYPSANYLAKDLLLSRVFYEESKALDDWSHNYAGELLKLTQYGKVRTLKESRENAELK